MKSFLKTVLAVMVAMILLGVMSVAFFTCTMVASLASSDENTGKTSAPGDVMYLKINGAVNEVPPSMPFAFDAFSGFTMNQDLSLRGYLNAISIAKNDPNIVGIYLNTDGMTASPASVEAIHDALSDFHTSGKWIISYNDSYSLSQYYVASVADSVFVNTLGSVSFDGMTTVLLYPKALLDKLGIEMQVFRVGSFKSAVEPYMIEHISDANRLQTETYLRNIWNQMVQDIAASRGIEVDSLNALANQAVSYMEPEELVQTKLIDRMLYKTDVEKIILNLTGKDKLEGIVAKDVVENEYDTYFPQDKDQKVAVLYAVGTISSSATSDGDDGIFYEDLIKDIRHIADDDDVKAMVLRVNSPGGSGFASEQIWKALMDLKAKKPLVVSMGDYAASGGYYISCLGDYVIAEPNTITGSIGVYGVIQNYSGLTTGKLGVNFEEVKTHNFGTLTNFRGVTDAERAKVQHGIESFYEIFTKRCAEGRNIPQDSIKAIAGGRVWTGSDAIKIGLVDELGGLDRAVAKAVEMAGLAEDSYSCVNYPEPKSTMDQLMEMMGEKEEDITLHIADKLIGTSPIDRSTLKFINHLQKEDRVQARSFDTVVF